MELRRCVEELVFIHINFEILHQGQWLVAEWTEITIAIFLASDSKSGHVSALFIFMLRR